MRERGSALLTVVVAVMVLLLISGAFFSTIIYQSKIESSEEKGLRAYYLAEAGIQYGIAKVLDGNLKKGDPLPIPETVDDPFGQGGSFTVQWQDNPSGPSFFVTSTGTYSGIMRNKKAEYKYNGSADGCSDGPLPNYPLWTAQSYQANSYVIYNGGAFYSRYYANSSQVPGVLGNPWQEITKKWRDFNVYNTNDIVCYNSAKFQARNYSSNQQPGLLSSPWQEITDQWRDFNEYDTGSIVIYGNKQFKARYWTKNQQPGLLSSPWQEITNEWRSFNVYNTGDVVIYNGHSYRANYYSQNSQPDTSPNWQLIS